MNDISLRGRRGSTSSWYNSVQQGKMYTLYRVCQAKSITVIFSTPNTCKQVFFAAITACSCSWTSEFQYRSYKNVTKPPRAPNTMSRRDLDVVGEARPYSQPFAPEEATLKDQGGHWPILTIQQCLCDKQGAISALFRPQYWCTKYAGKCLKIPRQSLGQMAREFDISDRSVCHIISDAGLTSYIKPLRQTIV